MFTVQDFINIFKYLKGETVDTLDSNLKIQAESERTKARSLFENTIDQLCFASDDYKRMKEFLIVWYASHRTIAASQQQAPDVFGMADAHLDELFRSFGFNYSDELEAFASKATFFLDLVNLYKVKGTPQGLIQVLNYYGITDLDLFEFFLRKDDSGELIFRPTKVTPNVPGEKIIPTTDILFTALTHDDPHWMMTRTDVDNLIAQNAIALPSKSPYFALRPKFKLFDLLLPLSIVQRFVQDQYAEWAATGIPPARTLQISKLNYSASVLELYLATVYTFNEHYNRTTGSSDLNFLCYDGSSVVITDIESEWAALTAIPVNRADREARTRAYFDAFTRPMTSNFLQTTSTAGTVLTTLHPSLKTSIDTLVTAGKGGELLRSLVRDLAGWIKSYVGPDYPDLAVIMFGIEALDYLFDVVDFFKPYHARLSTIELLFLNDTPLLDSIRLADILQQDIYQTIVDFDTCNSIACCSGNTPDGTATVDATACVYYSRDTYDCGSYYDAGAACDKDHFDTTCVQYITDTLVCSPDATSVTVQSGTGEPFPFDPIPMPPDSSAEIIYWQSGLWPDFDEGSSFDCPTARDICNVYEVDSTATATIAWDSTATFTYSVGHGLSLSPDTLDVWNSNTNPNSVLYFSMSDDAAWITVNPLTGVSLNSSDRQAVTVNYTTSALNNGVYNQNVTITSLGRCNNSPQTIPIAITVFPVEVIAHDSTGINVTAGYGQNPANDSFEIWNAGQGTLAYTITDGGLTWLDEVPDVGTSTGEHDTITVTYDTLLLPPGNYNATISLSSTSATNSPQTIPVALTVQAADLAIDSTGLINAVLQGNQAPAQSFEVWNAGAGILSYSISDDAAWLSVSPTSGTSTGEHDTINVIYDSTAMVAGVYSATITVTGTQALNSPQTIPVSLTVSIAGVPEIAADATALINNTFFGTNAPSQTFDVWNSGYETLNYGLSTDSSSWISITPLSGSSTGEHDTITVDYTTSDFIVDTFTGNIYITDLGASNSPLVIPVTMVIDGTATIDVSQATLDVEMHEEDALIVTQVSLDVEAATEDSIQVSQAQLDVEVAEATEARVTQLQMDVEEVLVGDMDISQVFVQVEVDLV